MRHFQLAVIANVAVILSSLSGCGGRSTTPSGMDDAVEFTTPAGQKIKVQEDGTTTSQSSLGGLDHKTEFAGAATNLKLPDDFPKELAYPGANVAMNQWTKFGNLSAGSVHLTTGDSLSKVKEHYEKKMEASGWKLSPNPLAQGNTEVAYVTGAKGNLACTLMMTKNKDKPQQTTITIAVQPQE